MKILDDMMLGAELPLILFPKDLRLRLIYFGKSKDTKKKV